jgi:hypothetical protein
MPQVGVLCGGCAPSHAQQSHGALHCIVCGDAFGEAFGLPRGVAVALATSAAWGISGLIWLLHNQLTQLRREIQTNAKILLGLAQVLSLISSVLGLLFPPAPRQAMSWLSLITIDVHRIVALECYGYDYYVRWFVGVFAPPFLATIAISMRAMQQRWKGADMGTIRQDAAGLGFFTTMLFYPKLSALIFEMVRCRDLGDSLSVLEADSSVHCTTARYTHYRSGAAVLVIFVPFGVPALLLAMLLHHGRRARERFERINQMSATVAGDSFRETLAGEPAHTESEHVFAMVHDRFKFCTADFRVECYWFEPVDLMRKLALTGLLQFIDRGTALQVLCGCCVAVAALALQLTVKPYRDPEANLLKTLVDVQIFLTFLISFILRVLISDNGEFDLYEPVGVEFYGFFLVGTLAAVILAGIGVTGLQCRRRRHFRARMGGSSEWGDERAIPLAASIGNTRNDVDDVVDHAMESTVDSQTYSERCFGQDSATRVVKL